MSSKPLQYESSKAVLQYMEANQRFALAGCCPSLRTTERLVPLRINQLSFESGYHKFLCITINHTQYLIGTYRDYPAGMRIPTYHQESNMNNFLPYDLDQFGISEPADTQLTPGDVLIKDWRGTPFEHDMQQHLEQEIRGTENLLHRKRGLCRMDVRHEVIAVEDLQRNLDALRLDLQPYLDRRDNIPAPFTPLAQLIVGNRDSYEVFRRKAKLHEMEKSLTALLFGNRKSIYVQRLSINCNYKILRLPAEMKLSISELKTDGDITMIISAIRNFTTDSSFPLNSLEVGDHPNIDFELPELQSARKLIFSYGCPWFLLSDFGLLRNQKVDFAFNFEQRNCIKLIRMLLNPETRRPIGSCYTMRVSHVVEIFEMVDRVLYGTWSALRLVFRVFGCLSHPLRDIDTPVSIPIGVSSMLNVSCQPVGGTSNYTLKLEIVDF